MPLEVGESRAVRAIKASDKTSSYSAEVVVMVMSQSERNASSRIVGAYLASDASFLATE